MSEANLAFFLIGLNIGLIIGTAIRLWNVWLRVKEGL